LFVFRLREKRVADEDFVRVPWHPYTTGVFVLACWSLVISTLVASPLNAGIGVVILAIGALVYWFWAARGFRRARSPLQ
jgi:APA family basic amino acid/polyamine antiporter